MLSIVLPCYNEKDNLNFLFKSIDPLVLQNINIEIILVDNGSTDGSKAIFEEEIKQRNTNIFKLVTVDTNLGYGHGILCGLRAAKGDVLAITHADRQTDPMDVLKALNIYEKHNESYLLVKGYRKNRRLGEAFFSYGMALFSSIVLGERLTEVNAQPKLFSKAFFDTIEEQAPMDFSLDLYLLYRVKKIGKIESFPVFFAKRVAGEAKGGSGSSFKTRYKLIKRILKYTFDLRKKVKA